jgi:uncharacterized lipoprotein YmbA
MIRGIAAMVSGCALAALVAGCASSPSRFYTLSPNVVMNRSVRPATLAIVVGPVSIPSTVDMPQIVVTKSANQLSPDQFNLWASPLRSNIAQVVCTNLAALLETSNVSSVFSVDADYRVSIDVQTFESVPGEAATLSALWMVRRVKDGKTVTGRTAVREVSTNAGYEALAAAHSRALGRMSGDIADAIRRFEADGA